MKNSIGTLCLLLILNTPLPAFGLVSLKDASYTNQWNDLEAKAATSGLRISRSYNSRSQQEGMFGFGWCTELETSLRRLSDGTIEVHDCEAGNIKYRPLDGELIAQGRPQEKMRMRRGGFLRLLATGQEQHFDENGRLTSLTDESARIWTLSYNPTGLLREARNSKLAFVFVFDPKIRRVKRITGPAGRFATYAYENGNLASGRDTQGQSHHYQYDALHNLVRVQYPDSTSEAVVYNEDLDQVVQFIERDGCQSNFTYEPITESSPKGHATISLTTCPQQTARRIRTEFWHAQRIDGQSFLSRVRTIDRDTITETSFDPEHGQPLQITNARGQVFHFSYDQMGRLTNVFEGKKESLRLLYEAGLRGPAEIQKPGGGSIRLFYGKEGRVRKIQSLSGSADVAEITDTMRNVLGRI